MLLPPGEPRIGAEGANPLLEILRAYVAETSDVVDGSHSLEHGEIAEGETNG